MIRCSLLFLVLANAMGSCSFAQSPRGGPRGAGREDDAFAQRLATLDEDHDGALSIEELLEHMHPYFAISDGDNDGALRGDEIRSLAEHLGIARMRPDGERGASSGASEGPREPSQGMRGESGVDGSSAHGELPARGGPVGTQPTPADIVARALTFDANRDGSLDRDELLRFVEDMIARRPPGPGPGMGGGGPGGRGPGGPGPFGGGGGPRGENRPNRPPQQ